MRLWVYGSAKITVQAGSKEHEVVEMTLVGMGPSAWLPVYKEPHLFENVFFRGDKHVECHGDLTLH